MLAILFRAVFRLFSFAPRFRPSPFLFRRGFVFLLFRVLFFLFLRLAVCMFTFLDPFSLALWTLAGFFSDWFFLFRWSLSLAFLSELRQGSFEAALPMPYVHVLDHEFHIFADL